MPEEQCAVDLGSFLDNIDDFSLNANNYNEIQKILKIEKPIKCSDAEKLISICLQDINEESKKYSINSLNILSFLLNKIKKEQCSPTANLVPSALGVLYSLKTVSSLYNVGSLQKLCFEILLIYPKETLNTLAVDHANEIYEIVELYCNSQALTQLILQPTDFILRLLKIMSQNVKVNFVRNGIDIWFSILIPTIFTKNVAKNVQIVEKAVQCVELLTEELLPFDYADNLKWLDILKCIYIPQKYPLFMKSLLVEGCDHWHRLWMICIKLLKAQITKTFNSVASPINSMLPVVEAAFKMDIKTRCRAFKCWNVLIDNFATESNEAYINKRVKLLLIPLVSNNAKVEETALEKFNTWWRFIVKFHKSMPNFSETVLLQFIEFCFGKPVSSNKPAIVPGLFSEATKKLTVQCFTNLLSHYSCTGCVDNIQTLQSKLITTTHLVTNWKHWINSLSMLIKIGSDIGDKTLIKQVRCAWKSFVATVGELPENNIRRDLFLELLAMLKKSLQDCQAEISDIVINVLLPALFEEDENIIPLLKITPENRAPIVKLFFVLIDQSNNNFYSRCNVDETIKSIRSSTDYLVQVSHNTRSSLVMDTIIKDMPTTESNLILWTALVESILEYENIVCIRMMYNIIVWPLKLNLATNVKKYISTWQKLYDYVSSKIITESINDEILQFFAVNKGINTIFSLTAILSIIGHILLNSKDKKIEKKTELLLKLLQKQVDDQHKQIQAVYLQLLQCVALVLNRLTKFTNVTCTKYLLLIINKILKVTPNIINEATNEKKEMLVFIEIIMLCTGTILKMDEYCKLNMLILEGIKESAHYLVKVKTNKNHILSILSTYESKDSETQHLIENITENDNESEEIKLSDHSFTTPNKKNTSKKSMKKEATIVNTVLENGEEFVVVKSNWKFNPKKLTDNQKEKFQRKREDIPALYQDLSQSQDEFKFTPWKTESNDANSSSKSNSISVNDDVNTVLGNIPNNDIMLELMDNMTKKENKNSSAAETTNVENIIKSSDATCNSLQSTLTKNDKSPRMALKDRVFRNVRNLIEKSNMSKEENVCSASISENGSKTPLGVKTVVLTPNANIINSAPSQLKCARPTRVKRPPIKFVDSEMFSIKRRRSLNSQRDVQTDCEESDHVTPSGEIDNRPVIDNVSHTHVLTEKLDLPLQPEAEEVNGSNKVQEIEPEPCEPCKEKDYNDDSKLLINHNISSNVDHVKEVMHNTDVKDITTPKANHISNPSTTTKTTETKNDMHNTDFKDITTPKANHISNPSTTTKTTETKNDIATPKSSTRKNLSKKSRIEKELAIDMVEGHPFLNAQSKKRFTRKALTNSPLTRTKATGNSVNNKLKVESRVLQKVDNKLKKNETNISVDETQSVTIDMTASQDIIESSQDSSVTTISVRPTKHNLKKVPIVTLDQINVDKVSEGIIVVTKKPLDIKKLCNSDINTEEKDDSVFPQNKTAEEQSTVVNLTENMDTEPIAINDDFEISDMSQKLVVESKNDDTCMEIDSQDTANADTQPVGPNFVLDNIKTTILEKLATSDIIADESNALVTNNDKKNEIIIQDIMTDETNALLTSNNKKCDKNDDFCMDLDSQNTANADTQPVDPNFVSDNTKTIVIEKLKTSDIIADESNSLLRNNNRKSDITIHIVSANEETNASILTSNETTKPIADFAVCNSGQEEAASSPFKDDEQRKKDFLNNTLEISPIKILSPARDDKTPSPETSNDYVVITLCSPVQSNGEPIEKCISPEIFTEDKISPDKRDLSPPREEIIVTNTSPSSLSLKKNRTQVRTGGRGAQMLGLCVPDRLQKVGPEKFTDNEEIKKVTPLNTSAKRNLRILYNTTESQDTSDDSEDSANFLKFKRNLPTTDCSPSGPILKRKLADIADEATPSPVSKRKRVSFHDPPVSTTVCVKKYIEPCGVRSPQDSAIKRQERQLRMQNQTPKSQRRLDKALTKTIESFVTEICSEETQMSSLDQTPVIEVVKTSDLNDTDPICPKLVDCKDPIDNIASELSSPAMKSLLVKEFEGKIETIGDLAKMTELEVNRLCIKAPKVQTVKKVLNTYLPKEDANVVTNEIIVIDEPSVNVEDELKTPIETTDLLERSEADTDTVEIQTDSLDVSSNSTQTVNMEHAHTSVQTDFGTLIYEHDIASHLSQRPDILEKLDDKVLETLTDTVVDRLPSSKSCEIIDRIVKRQCDEQTELAEDKRFSFLQKYLCDKFESKDLVLFCSGLLKKVYDNC